MNISYPHIGCFVGGIRLVDSNYAVELVLAERKNGVLGFRYTLQLPDGRKLFGKQDDVVEIEFHESFYATLRHALWLAFRVAAIRPGEEPYPEWFVGYTTEELAWSRSDECTALTDELSAILLPEESENV